MTGTYHGSSAFGPIAMGYQFAISYANNVISSFYDDAIMYLSILSFIFACFLSLYLISTIPKLYFHSDVPIRKRTWSCIVIILITIVLISYLNVFWCYIELLSESNDYTIILNYYQSMVAISTGMILADFYLRIQIRSVPHDSFIRLVVPLVLSFFLSSIVAMRTLSTLSLLRKVITLIYIISNNLIFLLFTINVKLLSKIGSENNDNRNLFGKL